MEKIIEIEEGRSLNFKASAFSPIQYNRLFPGRDFLQDMDMLYKANERAKDTEESESGLKGGIFSGIDYELFVRIAYTFAFQGMAPTPAITDEQKAFRAEYPDPWLWIDSFGTFSIYNVLPEIIDLWMSGTKTVSSAKKNQPAPPAK